MTRCLLFAIIATVSLAVSSAQAPSPAVPWDGAFHDTSSEAPIHFTARYLDAHGNTHRLEEWRLGQQHLRRKTDDRLDLHADRTASAVGGSAPDYLWQIVDLQKRIDHRVSTAGMLHLGMLYSYYSMAHLLTRPPGTFAVHPSSAPTAQPEASAQAGMAAPLGPASIAGQPCTWWQIDAAGQPSTRVCWVGRYGLPVQLFAQTAAGWRQSFQVDMLDTGPIPASVFTLDTAGLQVRDVDQLESED